MGHRNARLNVYGRRLIVQRVRVEGVPVAHVAKAMGVSRQCAHRWLARFDAEGDTGLEDRSSRPHSSPSRTRVEVEERFGLERDPCWPHRNLGRFPCSWTVPSGLRGDTHVCPAPALV